MQVRRAFPVLVALACLVLEATSAAAWARNEACRVAAPAEHGCCGAPASEPARAPGCPGGECCRIAPAMPLEAAVAPGLPAPAHLPALAEAAPAPPVPGEPLLVAAPAASPPGGPPLFLKNLSIRN